MNLRKKEGSVASAGSYDLSHGLRGVRFHGLTKATSEELPVIQSYSANSLSASCPGVNEV